MAHSMVQKKSRNRHKTLGTDQRIPNRTHGGLVAARYRFTSMLARISAISRSLGALPFDIFFGLASHIMLDKFRYMRPPATNTRPLSGVSSIPKKSSRMEESKSSHQSSTIGEMGALVVIPFDSAASAYSRLRSTGLVSISGGSGR